MNNAEQLLKDNGYYAAAVHGVSMLPLLVNHRDIAYIEPADTVRRLDVVLFRRTNGQLVLHRVLKCQGDRFRIAGDNDRACELVTREQILGVMTAFSRDGKTVKVTSRRYRLYAALWNATPLTKAILQRVYRRMYKGGDA